MKISINGTCFNERPSGARQRFIGLLRELLLQMPESAFTLFEPRDAAISTWFGHQPNLTVRKTPLPSKGRIKRWWQGLNYWPQVFSASNPDVFEALHLPLVRPRRAKSILTIHDVRSLLPGESPLSRRLHDSVIRNSLSRADEVVTVSAWMREVLLSLVPDLSVSTIYNGVDPQLFATQSDDAVCAFLKRHKLPRDYILAVGHIEPRKNYSRLLMALAQLQTSGNDFFLVILGQDSGQLEALRSLIHSLKLNDRVRVLSAIDDMELSLAYQACRLVAYPSLYEGFGIPILEAMASQRPIALSDIPVFNEITEAKAIYFPPTDIEAMAHALVRGMHEESARASVVAYGLKRVDDFRFNRLAQQMATVYRR